MQRIMPRQIIPRMRALKLFKKVSFEECRGCKSSLQKTMGGGNEHFCAVVVSLRSMTFQKSNKKRWDVAAFSVRDHCSFLFCSHLQKKFPRISGFHCFLTLVQKLGVFFVLMSALDAPRCEECETAYPDFLFGLYQSKNRFFIWRKKLKIGFGAPILGVFLCVWSQI